MKLLTFTTLAALLNLATAEFDRQQFTCYLSKETIPASYQASRKACWEERKHQDKHWKRGKSCDQFNFADTTYFHDDRNSAAGYQSLQDCNNACDVCIGFGIEHNLALAECRHDIFYSWCETGYVKNFGQPKIHVLMDGDYYGNGRDTSKGIKYVLANEGNHDLEGLKKAWEEGN